MNTFLRAIKTQKGMTYVELIVVLSIFSAISSVVIFNYRGFQERVDIKNLANDMALKIVEAQKASLSGRLPSLAASPSWNPSWKPAYGVFFDVSENKKFIYFVDANNVPPVFSGVFNGTDCTGECVSKYSITKGNYISQIIAYLSDGNTVTANDLTVSFARPDSKAVIFYNGAPAPSNLLRVEITVSSPEVDTSSRVIIHTSGRIDVK